MSMEAEEGHTVMDSARQTKVNLLMWVLLTGVPLFISLLLGFWGKREQKRIHGEMQGNFSDYQHL